jgi:hypothetical protein
MSQTTQELFDEMKDHFTIFEDGHYATTKSGKAKARKAIGEVKKLVTEYRKASVTESK